MGLTYAYCFLPHIGEICVQTSPICRNSGCQDLLLPPAKRWCGAISSNPILSEVNLCRVKCCRKLWAQPKLSGQSFTSGSASIDNITTGVWPRQKMGSCRSSLIKMSAEVKHTGTLQDGDGAPDLRLLVTNLVTQDRGYLRKELERLVVHVYTAHWFNK